MHLATGLSLLVSSLSWFLAKAEDIANSTHLDVNGLAVSFECSHRGKEWRICTQPDGWGPSFYCPAYSEFNKSELETVEWGSLGVPTPLTPCFTCPGADSNCSAVVREVLTANNISEEQNSTLGGWGVWDAAQVVCEELCEKRKEGELCDMDWNDCTPGALFCDYADDEMDYTNGTCKSCPTDRDKCFEQGFTASPEGQHNCRDCRLECEEAGASKVWIDDETLFSHPVKRAIQSSHLSATGSLHDCSELILDPEKICPGAQGKMCLVETREQFALNWQVADQAEKSGCVGVIVFRELYDHPFSLAHSELLIPFVFITMEAGKILLDTKIGVTAKVEVDMFGSACYPAWTQAGISCSASWPCDKDNFCDFNSVPTYQGDSFTEGYCIPCPENAEGKADPVACYFDKRQDGLSDTVQTVSVKTVQKVKSCAASCGAELTSESCKFCTSRVTGFEFGVEREEDKCVLCPQYDVQYPDRIVPLFGENITCWQLESFFQRLPVPKDSRNCQLAQSMNFICGCEGMGYAGANTQTKQAVLAWMPRVAAILSMLGSLFIIVDTQRNYKKRSKLINKILCTLSVFDFIGSFAMAFTTLPTPETDYIYGGKGNQATCTAQGFFIQMGTIACFCGVSLGVYYNLTIKQGWSDLKMRRKRAIYYLLIPPILTGFIYAGVGIPYYDSVIVWCNNSARWWPEAPVILAILSVTVVMGDMVYSVHQTERATSRYTRGTNKLSKAVIKQAVWFVGAFYVTWVPYLAVQYMWASGTGYDIYGLTLAAATMVPLQGFWNFIVYARVRYFKGKSLSAFIGKGFSSLWSGISSISSMIRSSIRRSTNRFSKTRLSRTTERDSANPASSLATIPTEKSPTANNLSVSMEPKGVPFNPPSEPVVVRLEARDPDEDVVDPDEDVVDPDEDVVDPDEDKEDAPGLDEDNKEAHDPDEDDEDAMYEMLLAG